MQAVHITPKFLMFQKTSDIVALNVLRFGRYLSYFSGVKVDLILPKKRQESLYCYIQYLYTGEIGDVATLAKSPRQQNSLVYV